MADLDALLAEFDTNYRQYRRSCMVCDSEHRELIDALMRRGGGGPTISRFLSAKFGVEISSPTLHKHKSLHLDAGPNPQP